MAEKTVVKTARVEPIFIKPGADLKKTGQTMIIYSSPGTGKTSLVKTLLGWSHDKGWGSQEPICTPEDILVIDIESGCSVLTDKDNKLCCTVFPVSEGELDKFRAMIEYLKEGRIKPKYVFVDNVSEQEKFYVLGLTKKAGLEIPRMKEWGDASLYVRKYLRELRDLRDQGINVIFNFWDMEVKQEDHDGVITSIICPMCMAKSWREYVGLVDHYAYMGICQKPFGGMLPGDRYLQFETYGMYQAKTRSDNLQKWEKANLAEIFRKLQ